LLVVQVLVQEHNEDLTAVVVVLPDQEVLGALVALATL
jgi:hypothetical protein